jgi:segregation and condensation protein B
MSLKAKLEAVIYAAEEPVTLAQLAALFAADALEWKAEQAAASAELAAEAKTGEELSLVNGEFVYLEPDGSIVDSAVLDSPSDAREPVAEPVPEASAEASAAPEEGAEPLAGPEPEPEAPAESAADAELELKRQAKLRDREVRSILRQLLQEIIDSYASDGRGVEIREIAGGYRMATKPECHDAVLSFVKSLKPALRLSLPALETLAVIAYKQPVTAPEVNEIRGVDSSGVFGSLLSRKLIATAGRKQVIGRPILYKTTREFLLRFGLKDVAELPSMEEFEKMAAIELDEPESEPQAIPGQEADLEQGPTDDDPASTSDASVEQESPLDPQTAVMAASDETPAQPGPHPTEIAAVEPAHTLPTPQPPADSPAIAAEPIPAEDAPAAPPSTEQAETENYPDDKSNQDHQND